MAWALVFVVYLLLCVQLVDTQGGILSTQYGCPVTPGVVWQTGGRRLHFRDNSVTWPENLRLIGPIKDNLIQWNGCFPDVSDTNPSGLLAWPEGNYCLLRSNNTCSGGLQKKDILHEAFTLEEEMGIYRGVDTGSNVLLPLCCSQYSQEDSHQPLQFPVHNYFFLIKHSDLLPCPAILHHSTEEQIISITGKEDHLNITLCFYQPLNFNKDELARYCPEGWLFHGGYCYFFSNKSLSWFDARDTCHKMQSNFVSITNEMEEAFLTQEMGKRISVSLEYYLGLSDMHMEGTWAWEDRVPAEEPFMNWHPIEPNDAMLQEDCAFFKIDTGNWDDINCHQQVPFICKRVAAVDPHPLTYMNRVTSSSVAEGNRVEQATDDEPATCSLSKPGPDQWLQIDLGQTHDVIAIIIMQGGHHLHSAMVYIGFTPFDFLDYGSHTCASDVTTRHMTSLIHCVQSVSGRYITIFQQSSGQVGMGIQICDLRIYATASYCGMPLGVSTGEVPAVQFSASSYMPPYWPHHARLHADTAWCASPEDEAPYLQVELGRSVLIQGFAVEEGGPAGRVDSFTLSTGLDSDSLTPLTGPSGEPKVFYIPDLPATVFYLQDGVTTPVIRINILTYTGLPCIKMEVYGCDNSKSVDVACPAKVGYPAVPLPRHSAAGLYFLFRFPCSGKVTGLRYHTSTSGNFWIHTWQAHDNLATGPKESAKISVLSPGEQHTELDEALVVTSGDVVSVTSESSLPLTFGMKDDDGVMTSDLQFMHYFNMSAHNLLLIDDIELNFTKSVSMDMTFALHFIMEYSMDTQVEDISCGGELFPESKFSSPNYPSYYGQGLHCVWNIFTLQDTHVAIDVPHFDLITDDEYGCSDTLAVSGQQDGVWIAVHQASGRHFPLIMVNYPRLQVELTSCPRDAPQRNSGFTAQILHQDCAGCGIGTMETDKTCTEPCGYLASPNYPHQYPVHIRPSWTISVTPGTYIRLELGALQGVQSELPTCLQDYVDVIDYSFEGNRKSLGVFCNARPPPPILYSSWHTLTIEFVSDEAYSATGFMAKYSSASFSLPDNVKQKINTGSTADCPQSWIQYARNCYDAKTLVQGKSWLEAETICSENGGHLVSIMDEEEMLVIHYLLTSVWRMPETKTYIGLTDHNREGQFRWSDSRPMIYTAWANTSTSEVPQPDGGELEDCTIIQLANLYFINQWHDVPCALNDVKQLICKISINGAHTNGIDIPNPASNLTFPPVISLHVCESGEYIREVHLCDGELHCKDGSDEVNCTICEMNQFKCGDSNQCIHVSKYCDFIPDCHNGADEATCVFPECKLNEFRCSNGQCVDGRGRCNIIVDCIDKSDEDQCDTCQRPDTFQCYDGRCIPWHTRCDRVKDCSGCTIEDEKGCFKTPFSLCNDIIQCDWRPLDGYGSISLSHDLTADRLTSNVSHISISYKGLDTVDEILAIMEMSFRCEQHVEFLCPEARDAIWWESMTSITWETSQLISCNLSKDGACAVVLRDKAALPVTELAGNLLACGNSPPINLGALECFVEVGAQEVGSEMTCNNGQRTLSKYLCLFEEDQYGVQQGCRDMSHLQGCGSLERVYTECRKTEDGLEYRGTTSTTESGWTCQRWDMQTPHGHPFRKAESFGEETVSDAHNFCRNPFGPNHPLFCFTVYPDRRYEFCDIPMCSNDTEDTWIYECPDNYVQCPGNYCIPLHYVCDGQWHCANGEDEEQCDTYHCEGRYTCAGEKNCLPFQNLCDGKKDCFHGDDEYLCDVKCPQHCTCSGLAFNCSSLALSSIPETLDIHIRTFDLSFNNITTIDGNSVYLPFISDLYLSNNRIKQLSVYQFKHMKNLLVLDLQSNHLTYLLKDTFHNLANLKILLLEGNNNLKILESHTFDGLTSLSTLSLRGMQISNIIDDTFSGLRSLTALDLSHNNLQELSKGSFNDLEKLQNMTLVGNSIKIAFRQTFKVLPNLAHLRSDKFKFCCLADQVPREQCFPPQDPISTCEDLMSTVVLRSFLWILGIMALVGNFFVIIWRLRFPTANVPEIMINNLAVSDLQMGFYMLIIAGVDMYYKGVFIEYADQWKESWLCNVAGFLGTLSSEGSVLFLCLLTIDRVINIIFPFSSFRFTRKSARVAATGVWTLAIVSSALPFVPLDYFGDNFYGRSGVCLALPITNERPAGWEFSTVVFIAFNLVAFLIIAVGYVAMYVAINQSGAKASAGMQRRQQISLARNMVFIVATDFICWLPIICMGLAALNGATISGDVYAWVVVFVLPVNSAINPILYTISSLNIKAKLFGCRKEEPGSMSETSRLSTANSFYGGKHAALSVGLAQSMDGQNIRSFTCLHHVTMPEVLQAVRQVASMLDSLHSSGMVHGNLSSRSVSVAHANMTGTVKVTLSSRGQLRPGDMDTDYGDDIMAFGTIVKEVLQALKARERMPDSVDV